MGVHEFDFEEVVAKTILSPAEQAMVLERCDSVLEAAQAVKDAVEKMLGTPKVMKAYTTLDAESHCIGEVTQTAIRRQVMKMAQEQS